MSATRGRGRPAIGAPIQIRLPADLLAWADAKASERGVARAEFLRDALEYARALEYPDALDEQLLDDTRDPHEPGFGPVPEARR